jgi:hypothetical protein
MKQFFLARLLIFLACRSPSKKFYKLSAISLKIQQKMLEQTAGKSVYKRKAGRVQEGDGNWAERGRGWGGGGVAGQLPSYK